MFGFLCFFFIMLISVRFHHRFKPIKADRTKVEEHVIHQLETSSSNWFSIHPCWSAIWQLASLSADLELWNLLISSAAGSQLQVLSCGSTCQEIKSSSFTRPSVYLTDVPAVTLQNKIQTSLLCFSCVQVLYTLLRSSWALDS